jgi:hypothetical protein
MPGRSPPCEKPETRAASFVVGPRLNGAAVGLHVQITGQIIRPVSLDFVRTKFRR